MASTESKNSFWQNTVGVSEWALTQYRRLEKNPRWKKTMDVLDVGMLNSFHLPVMYSIIASQFGWGAALPLIGLTPLGLIVGLSVGVMAFNIAMRSPILFPKLGEALKNFTERNAFVQKFPSLKRFLQRVANPAENRVITQKAVGFALLGFTPLALLSGSPMTMVMGAWYGMVSGVSNWVQGLRFAAENRNNALPAGAPKEDIDDAVFKTRYGRTLEKLFGKPFVKVTHYPPLLAGISMLGMGLSMTAQAGASAAQIFAGAVKAPSVFVGSALFLTAAAFQGARVAGRCNWGPSFGRVAAGAGMVSIAGFALATGGVGGLLTASFWLASASALSNFLVARLEDRGRSTGQPTAWPFEKKTERQKTVGDEAVAGSEPSLRAGSIYTPLTPDALPHHLQGAPATTWRACRIRLQPRPVPRHSHTPLKVTPGIGVNRPIRPADDRHLAKAKYERIGLGPQRG